MDTASWVNTFMNPQKIYLLAAGNFPITESFMNPKKKITGRGPVIESFIEPTEA